jgi:hypothetical protein
MLIRCPIVLAIGLSLGGCAHEATVRATQPSAIPSVEFESARIGIGGRGRANAPQRLFVRLPRSPQEAAAPEPGESFTAQGGFTVIEVAADASAWDCELPATVARVRMVDGDQTGREGWLIYVGKAPRR